ncbi:hypothetical protein SUDANB15_00005 [Streptomyces sp. enrichment culture]
MTAAAEPMAPTMSPRLTGAEDRAEVYVASRRAQGSGPHPGRL